MDESMMACLRQPLSRLALCLRLLRADGVAIGFTSHDEPVAVDGLVYLPKPGLLPSAVVHEASFAADSMAIDGMIDSALVTEADLDLGRWRGARLTLFLCDWETPAAGRLVLARGAIGEIYRTGPASAAQFGLELLSDTAGLRMAGAPLVSPLCRADLGDDRCGVDMDSRWIDRAVFAGYADTLTLDRAVPEPDRFAHGTGLLLSGPAAGVRRRILGIEGLLVHLGEPIAGCNPAGSGVRLFEGCDRRFTTCANRFGNAPAFDGEPHVPGNDAMLRYDPA
jgi:uncharacterized phage protein (TIGR02218 family)